MNNENIISNLITSIENRDAEAVGKLLSDDVIFENVPEGSSTIGKEAAQNQFAAFFQKASSIRWDIKRKIISENTAIIERINHICFLGKNIKLPMVTIVEMVNGKIKLFRDYFDAQSFVKQLES